MSHIHDLATVRSCVVAEAAVLKDPQLVSTGLRAANCSGDGSLNSGASVFFTLQFILPLTAAVLQGQG